MSKEDKEVDYESINKLLLNWIEKGQGKSKCYASILLIQLRNGARIREAVRAYQEFLRTNKVEITIRLERKLPFKKKIIKRRLMIIPEEVREAANGCIDLLTVDGKTLTNRVRVWARIKLKVNTESLRCAFIVRLLKAGVNTSVIAMYASSRFIVKCIPEKEAGKALKTLITI